MKVNIGDKIRELRHKKNCTQTELAEFLDVSPQAVSRWEMNITYPDMGLLPEIADYFEISIDELFEKERNRKRKIEDILSEAEKMRSRDNGVDINIEPCLTLLRNGLVEFPRNEKLMHALAETLSNAGWVRLGEHIHYNEAGYLVHDVDTHWANEYWSEAVKLFETLVTDTKNAAIRNNSVYHLILLYRNLGMYEKALALADEMPELKCSSELLRATATDGEANWRYEEEAVTRLVKVFSNHLIYMLMSKKSNFQDDLPVRLISTLIKLVEILIEYGNRDELHSELCGLYLYLSEHQWRCGFHNEAFVSLDYSLKHAKYLDEKYKDGTNKGVTVCLPEDWPMCMMPDFKDVQVEIQADQRWSEWVKRCREN